MYKYINTLFKIFFFIVVLCFCFLFNFLFISFLGSATAHLLGLRVRIPPRAWMFVGCECCVLSGRGLCDGPIPLPEESYRLWCVTVCDQMNNNPLHLTWLGRQSLD
jgi:hypothetical protein